MRRKAPLPELLAPAGGPEAFYAAAEAGADAVYLGGELFSARAGADNFSRDELRRAVLYAHLRGIKVYVTVNTLLFDREITSFLSAIAFLAEVGVDALIVADAGGAALISAHFPGLVLHASTQMSAHSLRGADALYRMGFSRVVPARELSAADLAVLTEKAAAEIEVFLHGALCVCHSGQCLFSSLVGGRSGNRGACAQPCRLPYNGGKYPLSLKDLSLADHIPALIDLGVSSLKIEGRMKSPQYVYGVTHIYRRLLDEGRGATWEEKEALARLFSRGGFTDGYFTGHIRAGMTGIRSEEDKRKTGALEERHFAPVPVPTEGTLTLKPGEPALLRLACRGKEACVTGEVPLPAERAALTEAGVKKQMEKLGGTFFRPADGGFTAKVADGLFLPMGALNALRRAGVEALEKEFLRAPANTLLPSPFVFPAEGAPLSGKNGPLRTAVFYRKEVFLSLDTSYFDLCFLPLADLPEQGKMPAGVLMPAVIFDSETEAVRALLRKARQKGVRFALCGGLGAAALAAEEGFLLGGDFRLNITNSESAARFRKMGFSFLIGSPELSLAAARALSPIGLLVMGRVPLMVTERCYIREIASCDACGRATLTDRRGVRFPLWREYPHRNLIFNSLPTYMGDRQADLRAAGLAGEHFIFSVEDAKTAAAMLAAYKSGAPLAGARRLPAPAGS